MFTLLLSKRLRRAGRREIGGILMGKQVAHERGHSEYEQLKSVSGVCTKS